MAILGQPVLIGLVSLILGVHYTGLWTIPTRGSLSPTTRPVADDTERWSCRPFLPKLFVETPPSAEHPLIKNAAIRLSKHLTARFSKGDIDSLSVAIITSDGAVYEENFGVMRGNESSTSSKTTSHSMYRIASTSKLFTVLEGLILQQKGALSWDDPVEKYLPKFKPRLDGFDSSKKIAPSAGSAPISVFQLASHMSGLGRDWPPGTVSQWPDNLVGGGPPPTNGLPFPSHEALYKAISEIRLVSPPWAYPAYSNTGTGVLGLTMVAANAAAFGPNQPDNYADLVRRDIFEPMGLNGSHFLTTEANKHLVVVPSLAPEVADQDFLDAMNPAGGQFSSLSDMITVTQMLLNPAHPKSLITQQSMDFWLHSVHDFEEDDWTQIGLIWEIMKAQDSNGRLRKLYWKLGAMAGYHAAVGIHPGTSYGVVVLMGGNYPDATKLGYDAFEIFQPAIDGALAEMATSLYAGQWSSSDGNSTARIVVEKGTLYLENFTLSGKDILRMFYAPGRLALRSTERRDEFRIDTGIPGYNGVKHMGCYPYWNGQDLWGLRNGAPINLIYFTGSEFSRVLHVPSSDIVLKR